MPVIVTPTQRTLAELRRQGFLAGVVERWNPHARVRQDLFGIVDVLAVSAAGTLAIQATSGAHVAARLAKLREAPALPQVLAAGWRLEVWGWRKSAKSRRWELRRELVSLGVMG